VTDFSNYGNPIPVRSTGIASPFVLLLVSGSSLLARALPLATASLSIVLGYLRCTFMTKIAWLLIYSCDAAAPLSLGLFVPSFYRSIFVCLMRLFRCFLIIPRVRV
jgi:hypothetical protein